ncbi:MAG: alginate export family protein [Rhodanobacter sp.]
MIHLRSTLLPVCLLAVLSTPCWADGASAQPAPTGAQSATTSGAPWVLEWDARARDEQVNDDGFSRHANADTLRVRLGIKGNFGNGWSGLLEGAGVANAGDHYNSGANRQVQYPAVTDPTGADLNQYWLRWQGDQVGATVGRQRLLIDNQRWVGNSGWRQTEQTFDAVALQWKPLAELTLSYDWLDRVHRVAGPDAINRLARERRLNTHLLNAAWTHGTQQWVGYTYLHEDRDVASASSATYGVRWTGKLLHEGNGFGWTVDTAQQHDYANNPQHFTHSYWLLEPSWTEQGITAKLGWEHLGGNGHHALQTPLATLHAFNGWDDQFNVTPPGGLEDRYASVNGAFGHAGLASKLAWTVAYHDYRADHGGRYGSEWDASLGFPLARGLTGLLKVADYHADGFSRDNTKLWLQLEWRGQQSLASSR